MLEESVSWHCVKGFAEVHKAAVQMLAISLRLLYKAPESEDVVECGEIPSKTSLSRSTEACPLRQGAELYLKYRPIEFGQYMTNHNSPVVPRVEYISRFVDRNNSMHRPLSRKPL